MPSAPPSSELVSAIAARQGGLAYLDQVSVGVTDVAADFSAISYAGGLPSGILYLHGPGSEFPAASVT
jgi:hypothetical protein